MQYEGAQRAISFESGKELHYLQVTVCGEKDFTTVPRPNVQEATVRKGTSGFKSLSPSPRSCEAGNSWCRPVEDRFCDTISYAQNIAIASSE